jgi:hypothetical protein
VPTELRKPTRRYAARLTGGSPDARNIDRERDLELFGLDFAGPERGLTSRRHQEVHPNQDEGTRSALFVPDRDLASGAAPNYANAL